MLVPAGAMTQVSLEKGLVAYYPFNGNFNDESVNKNHPKKINAKLTADRYNSPNSACFFDGKTNFIRIPDHPSLHFQQTFSISVWVKVNGFYDGPCHGNRIIMKGPTDYLRGNYFLTFDDNFSSNGANCEIKRPDTKRQAFYAPNAAPTGPHYIIPGKWYQLTYTHNGENARLYLDCNLVASGNSRSPGYSNSYDLFFGKMDNDQYPYWFNGCLDEVRLYNRVLNTDEIRALCNSKIPGLPPCTGINKPSAAFSFTVSNCTTVNFKLTNDSKKEIKTVKWFFGDNASSGQRSPHHSYSRTGNYKVKAIVTNELGCSDTILKEIRLQELNADFTFTERGQPGAVEFRAKNNRASYSWDFGDGNRDENETVVSHQFQHSGSYTVRAIAQNASGCQDTAGRNIRIILPETTTVNPAEKLVTGKKEIELVQSGLEDRKKDVQQTILLDHDSVAITLYDNGIIDGDSVSLIYNDKVIASHLLLGSKPVIFTIKLDAQRSSNEIVMYAENIGSIPPNTALMIIDDGEKRHSVNISSTIKSNGAVSFILNEKKITAAQ